MKCSWSCTFPIFDISIHSGDIRDQSRKLSKSRWILDVFYPPKFCWGHPLQNWCPQYHPGLEPRYVVKFCAVTPTPCKVIGAHMWNFKPNFKCSPIIFFGGTHNPVCGVRIASLGQSLSRVKISGVSTPYGPKYSFPKKSIWVVQTRMCYFMDSGPKLAGLVSLKTGVIFLDNNLSGFGYLLSFRRYSRSYSEVV